MTEERNEITTEDRTRTHAEGLNANTEMLSEPVTTDACNKRKRNRTIEILEGLTPKSMTESEMISYITFLRNEREKTTTKIKALEDNCKSAYEKVRAFDKKLADCLNRMEQAYNYAENCVAQAHKAIYQNKIVTRVDLTQMLNKNINKGDAE